MKKYDEETIGKFWLKIKLQSQLLDLDFQIFLQNECCEDEPLLL